MHWHPISMLAEVRFAVVGTFRFVSAQGVRHDGQEGCDVRRAFQRVPCPATQGRARPIAMEPQSFAAEKTRRGVLRCKGLKPLGVLTSISQDSQARDFGRNVWR